MNQDSQQPVPNKQNKPNRYIALAILGGVVLLALGALFFYIREGTPLGVWVAVSGIGLLVVALAGVFFAIKLFKQDKPHEPDYYVFFILGITWIPLGFATENSAFWILGLVFMAIGLANKDKWKKKEWKDLPGREKKLKYIVIGLLGLLALIGFVLYYLYAR